MDTDDVSAETRLTKGDAAPPPAPKDDLSDMTGSTRESKAQRYANAQVKEVVSQYSTQITSMRTDIHGKDDRIAQLELRLQQMHNINPPPASLPPASNPTEPDKVSLPPPPRHPSENENVIITVINDDNQEGDDMQISTDKEGVIEIDEDDDISFADSDNSDLHLLDYLSGPVIGKRPMDEASSVKSKSSKKQQTSSSLALLSAHQSSSSKENEIL